MTENTPQPLLPPSPPQIALPSNMAAKEKLLKLRPYRNVFVLATIGLLLLTGSSIFVVARFRTQRNEPAPSPSTTTELASPQASPGSLPSTSPSASTKNSPIPKASAKTTSPTPTVSPTSSPASTATTGSVSVHVTDQNGQSIQYASLALILPSNQVLDYQADSGGNKAISNLSTGNYSIMASYAKNNATKNFTIAAGQTTFVTVAVSTTPTPTPSPSPDTQAPILDAVNGPYDWGTQGICFTINGDQVHDNNPSSLQFGWSSPDSFSISSYGSDAIKCYQGLTPGGHTISAQVKDAAGNQSNRKDVYFNL